MAEAGQNLQKWFESIHLEDFGISRARNADKTLKMGTATAAQILIFEHINFKAKLLLRLYMT
jgi:hypothetical protein